MMDPTTVANNAVDKAAMFGAETFVAVIAMLLMAALVVLVVKVVSSNTQVLASQAPILERICDTLDEHDQRAITVVAEICRISPAIADIDTRTIEMDTKLNELLGRDLKGRGRL